MWRKGIAGSLALVLLLAQLAWAGHVQFHTPENSDSCQVCVHLDRQDAAAVSPVVQCGHLPAAQGDFQFVVEPFPALAVERPRARAPPLV